MKYNENKMNKKQNETKPKEQKKRKQQQAHCCYNLSFTFVSL